MRKCRRVEMHLNILLRICIKQNKVFACNNTNIEQKVAIKILSPRNECEKATVQLKRIVHQIFEHTFRIKQTQFNSLTPHEIILIACIDICKIYTISMEWLPLFINRHPRLIKTGMCIISFALESFSFHRYVAVGEIFNFFTV